MLKLPPPVWALICVLAALGVCWALGWPVIPGLHSSLPGMILVVLSFAPALWAVALFRRAGTELNPTSAANQRLVTSGPFSFTRNPMYLGLVILSLGTALWVDTWPLLLAPAAIFAISNWVHIPFEEAKMRAQFGDAFDAYTQRVRRWL